MQIFPTPPIMQHRISKNPARNRTWHSYSEFTYVTTMAAECRELLRADVARIPERAMKMFTATLWIRSSLCGSCSESRLNLEFVEAIRPVIVGSSIVVEAKVPFGLVWFEKWKFPIGSSGPGGSAKFGRLGLFRCYLPVRVLLIGD